jgi:prepilin-type N-terminal cleavage/methylation domain-containing protein
MVLIKDKKSGFTLIEMLVAMAIFSIVAGLAIGIFTIAMKSQRKILAQQQLLDQTSYVLEYMSRSIRMAKKDDITIAGSSVNCLLGDKANYEITATGQGGIKFRNDNDICQEFYLEGEQLKETKGVLYSNLPLTSPSLKVKSFKIIPSGWSQDPNIDKLQPAVTIFLDIESKDGAEIKIQTTISQRNLDVEY